MNTLLRRLFPPCERRSAAEIRGEVHEELQFHLDQLAADARASGADEPTADAAARGRFGVLAGYARACERVWLKERVMLLRVNFVLLMAIAGLLGLLAWQNYAAQARTQKVLEALVQRSAVPGTGSPAGVAGPGVAQIQRPMIRRPGVYAMPVSGRMTVRRLIVAAGGLEAPFSQITVRPENAGSTPIGSMSWVEYADSSVDLPVNAGDLVELK